eukprot:3075433-Prymnesium_polylepis.1
METCIVMATLFCACADEHKNWRPRQREQLYRACMTNRTEFSRSRPRSSLCRGEVPQRAWTADGAGGRAGGAQWRPRARVGRGRAPPACGGAGLT